LISDIVTAVPPPTNHATATAMIATTLVLTALVILTAVDGSSDGSHR